MILIIDRYLVRLQHIFESLFKLLYVLRLYLWPVKTHVAYILNSPKSWGLRRVHQSGATDYQWGDLPGAPSIPKVNTKADIDCLGQQPAGWDYSDQILQTCCQ